MTNATPRTPQELRSYTVSRAAARLGVSRVTVWRWIRDGHLPATRLGPRTTRISRDDVERLLAGVAASSSRVDRNGTVAVSSALDPAAHARGTRDADHAVQFYEADAFLDDAVAEFIAAGLRAGEVGAVVATPRRRTAIESRLLASGCGLGDRYIALDAEQTLARIMADGAPDAARFAEVVEGICARANDRPLRLFGEMVSLLVATGNAQAAVRLEALWNDLLRHHQIRLLCAYSVGAFGKNAQSQILDEVCAAHSRVIPAESYPSLARENDRLRAIVLLQQQTHQLRTELAERQ